jgi:hypothetical protein
MDVSVYRLNAPLTVPGFHLYGDPAQTQTLPVGTYWIPMAQGQKHWIQAMLNEDTYIPFDVTYDVTAWSNPLLMNLRGGWTGSQLSPSASLVAPMAAPSWQSIPSGVPSIGLWEIPGSTAGFQAAGQARWLFDTVWHLPYTNVTAADVKAGLPGIDVLLVPNGYANYGLQALGAKGKKALRDWVGAGGRFVGWQGGAQIAAQSGLSTATLSSPTRTCCAALRDDGSTSPLSAGSVHRAGDVQDDDVMGAGSARRSRRTRPPRAPRSACPA